MLAFYYWEQSCKQNNNFAVVKRNLALFYFNKKRDIATALKYLKEAYSLDKSNGRIMLELYELLVIFGTSDAELLAFIQDNIAVATQRDDLYLYYIALINTQKNCYYAKKLLLSRQFHPWEGGEGKVSKVYKEILINIANDMLSKGDKHTAIEELKQAFSFPTSLGEGKLALDFDNDIWYMIGEIYESLGDNKNATYCFNMATQGEISIDIGMYYNDSPIIYQYYMAKAYKKMGDLDRASLIKQKLQSYYHAHFGKEFVIDYFAVSLPDMLIWEQDINNKNDAYCMYLLDLANNI